MNLEWSITRKATATAIGAAALALLALGCSGSRATKAGKTNGTVVLRMASRDSDPASDLAAAYFVERVGQLSDGMVRIRVVPGWGSERSDDEQQIVRAVAARKVDLGVVGTRVFDTLGVSSLEALTAPMLIDSYPLERAVLAGPLPKQMLDGLGKLGVTGLAVLGEGLRKPVAVRRPLLDPSDWHGITFAAYRSRVAAEAIRALGARPSDAIASALDGALLEHRVQGAENDLVVYQSNARQYRAPYVTANVNLWPRTETVLANPHRLAELTSKQRGWLRKAAADAAARSTTMFDHDTEIAVDLCKSGAHFANASRAQLAALRRALQPVYARLELNRQTKAFITQIEQLKKSTPSRPLAIPSGCAGKAWTAAAAARKGSTVLNGVYRIKWSQNELIAAGASPHYANANFGFFGGREGVLTLILRDGDLRLQASGASWSPCPGTYALTRTVVTIAFQPPQCEGRITARWLLQRRQLRLRVRGASDPGDAVTFGAKAWTKIG